MSRILDTVNQRTQLVGQNRLELLTFRLLKNQRYGINVFKVKEVLQCPRLTSMPNLHPHVIGVAHIRGQVVPVIDMSLATGGRAITNPEERFIVISEFNRSIQGFLVGGVDRIINMNWEEILPPPQGSGKSHLLTAVTKIDDELIEILDVEKILNEVSPANDNVSQSVIESSPSIKAKSKAKVILVVDDSSVARAQVKKTVEALGYRALLAFDGRDALNKLKQMAENGDVSEQICLVVSDIEMPEMDGYTLTTEIKKDPRLATSYVLLHSSLSGGFNESMIKSVGADAFIPKFNSDELYLALYDAIIKKENS